MKSIRNFRKKRQARRDHLARIQRLAMWPIKPEIRKVRHLKHLNVRIVVPLKISVRKVTRVKKLKVTFTQVAS